MQKNQERMIFVNERHQKKPKFETLQVITEVNDLQFLISQFYM